MKYKKYKSTILLALSIHFYGFAEEIKEGEYYITEPKFNQKKNETDALGFPVKSPTSNEKKKEFEIEQELQLRYEQKGPELTHKTGTVRIVRTSPVTEVFFLDLSESYVIPRIDNYYKIYNRMLESQKTRKSVTFKVDNKKRIIYEVLENDEKNKAN